MPITNRDLGPQRWWEYPVYWFEGVKFRWELSLHKKFNNRG